MKQAENGEVVILDSPPGTSCPFIHTVSGADYVILVTEPTPFGLSDLKQSVETLKTLGRPDGVIINRAGLGDLEIYDYLTSEGIPVLLEIPFNKTIAAHYSRGEIAGQYIREWQSEFMSIYQTIINFHGNSNNQR